MHNCRYGRVKPKTRARFWQDKRQSNVRRDKQNITKLKKQGWKVLIIWECQTRGLESLAGRLEKFLSD